MKAQLLIDKTLGLAVQTLEFLERRSKFTTPLP